MEADLEFCERIVAKVEEAETALRGGDRPLAEDRLFEAQRLLGAHLRGEAI